MHRSGRYLNGYSMKFAPFGSSAPFFAAAAALGVTACHIGGGYTVGGTVTGLKGSGLVLQNNSGNDVT